jgi:modulator of FtsH protease
MQAHGGYGPVADAPSSVRALFVGRVYSYFFLSLLVAVLTGTAIYSSHEAVVAVAHLRWALWIAALVILMIAGAARHQTTFNTILLLVFACVTGAAAAPAVFLANTYAPGVGLQAAVLTAGVFGALSGYAWLSKEDFSFLYGALIVGTMGIFLSGLLLLFTGSPILHLVYGFAGVMLFSGYVLYDTSRVMQRYPPGAVIPACISLYWDVFILFLWILRILAMTSRRD